MESSYRRMLRTLTCGREDDLNNHHPQLSTQATRSLLPVGCIATEREKVLQSPVKFQISTKPFPSRVDGDHGSEDALSALTRLPLKEHLVMLQKQIVILFNFFLEC